MNGFDDVKKFPIFEDDWLRGGPVRRWVPKGLADRAVYVFETGGTTGLPKSRIVIDDFKIDYEMMSDTLPDKYFPKGSNWLMLGPSGPRRLRLAIEHLAQYRGGICFCVDLDPRYVVKCLKERKMAEANAYKEHCIDQAITVLAGGHDIKCMFTTPEAAGRARRGAAGREAGGQVPRAEEAGPAGRAAVDQGARASPASSPAAPSSPRSSPARPTRRCSTTARST